jgi:hypothetical protein
MRVLAKPQDSAADVLHLCALRAQDDEFRNRLHAAVAAATAAETHYDALADQVTLSAFPQSGELHGLTGVEVGWLYGTQMARAKGAAREIYNRIRNSSANNRCPLCGFGMVSTVDHHLPKSRYTSVGLTPINLVPSCADCNKVKGSRFPAVSAEETLHPYFDDFSNVVWLKGDVREGTPPAVIFSVDDSQVTNVDALRLRWHIRVFNLGPVFSSNAAEEMALIKASLHDLFDAGADYAVRSFLIEQRDTRAAANPNTWQAATYAALSESDWYCGGGLRN